jgi:TetR/AcrR family transcriptional repressor of nem operon
MAGVKRFDQSAALERAMRVFWERGYEATSIQDLLDATGINRGSLYATFGDKRHLFLAAVDRYMEKVAMPLFDLAQGDPREAIEGMFEAIIRRTSDRALPRGCLITNSALECRRLGGEIKSRIEHELKLQEAKIYAALRRAVAMKLLSPDQDLRALAHFFLGVAHGLNVVNKAGGETAMLKSMAKVAMRVWPRRDDHSASPRN